MKNFLLVVLTLITVVSVNGQQRLDSSYRRVETDLSMVMLGSGNSLFPSIGYGFNKQSIYIGSVIFYSKFYGLNGIGAAAGYKFYPNDRKNRANLYFSYNILYYRLKYGNHGNTHLENTIGFGLDLHLLKEFYFTSECASGIDFRKWDRFYGYGRDNNWTLFFKFGIRKRFRR